VPSLDFSDVQVRNLAAAKRKLEIPAFGAGCPATTDALPEGAINKYLGSEPGARSAADSALSAAIALKENPLTFGLPMVRTVNAVAMPAATSGVDGYLSAAAFTTFAAKVGTSRLIATTAPLTGGGDLSADRTLVLDFTAAWTWTKMQVNATGVGFNGAAAVGKSAAYTFSNQTALRTINVSTATLTDALNCLAAIVADLKTVGLFL